MNVLMLFLQNGYTIVAWLENALWFKIQSPYESLAKFPIIELCLHFFKLSHSSIILHPIGFLFFKFSIPQTLVEVRRAGPQFQSFWFSRFDVEAKNLPAEQVPRGWWWRWLQDGTRTAQTKELLHTSGLFEVPCLPHGKVFCRCICWIPGRFVLNCQILRVGFPDKWLIEHSTPVTQSCFLYLYRTFLFLWLSLCLFWTHSHHTL